MYSIMSVMASSGSERIVKIVVWIVVAVLLSGVSLKLVEAAYDLVTGGNKIAERFVSGTPATVWMSTFKSNSIPDDRPIYIRADALGSGKCETTDPEVTLSPRTGPDVTVDGTSWRQIYVMEATRGGDHRITCLARKGAEFAVGRDGYWDGSLYFGLAIVGIIGAFVAWESLRRKLSPTYAAARAEREAARRAQAERLKADVEQAEAKAERAEEAYRQTVKDLEEAGYKSIFPMKVPRISLRKAKPFLKPPLGTMDDGA